MAIIYPAVWHLGAVSDVSVLDLGVLSPEISCNLPYKHNKSFAAHYDSVWLHQRHRWEGNALANNVQPGDVPGFFGRPKFGLFCWVYTLVTGPSGFVEVGTLDPKTKVSAVVYISFSFRIDNSSAKEPRRRHGILDAKLYAEAFVQIFASRPGKSINAIRTTQWESDPFDIHSRLVDRGEQGEKKETIQLSPAAISGGSSTAPSPNPFDWPDSDATEEIITAAETAKTKFESETFDVEITYAEIAHRPPEPRFIIPGWY